MCDPLHAARVSRCFGVLVLLVATADAQQPPPADRLAPVSALIGKWTGSSEGQPGSGTVELEYQPAIGRHQETYLLHGPDEFEEVFEMAEPGKDFAVYSRTKLEHTAEQPRLPVPDLLPNHPTGRHVVGGDAIHRRIDSHPRFGEDVFRR